MRTLPSSQETALTNKQSECGGESEVRKEWEEAWGGAAVGGSVAVEGSGEEVSREEACREGAREPGHLEKSVPGPPWRVRRGHLRPEGQGGWGGVSQGRTGRK